MPDKKRVLSVIMGGGRGTRLYPLTKERCKPAVPLAGKYRLVDIPISNCINSDINRIFILSQFQTASLHRVGASLVGTKRPDQHDVFVEQVPGEQLEKVPRRGVGPVQILDTDHHRIVAR